MIRFLIGLLILLVVASVAARWSRWSSRRCHRMFCANLFTVALDDWWDV